MITKYQSYNNQFHENKLIEKILADDSQNFIPTQNVNNFSFQVCIDIGDGRIGTINIHQHSDPFLCSLEFCKRYHLDQVIAGILSQSIQQKIHQQKNRNIILGAQQKINDKINNRCKILNKPDKQMNDKNSKKSQENISRLYYSTNHSKNITKMAQSNRSMKRYKQKESNSRIHIQKKNQISRELSQKIGNKSIQQKFDREQQKSQKVKRKLKQIQNYCSKPKLNLTSSYVNRGVINQIQNKKFDRMNLNTKNKTQIQSKQNLSIKPQLNQICKTSTIDKNYKHKNDKQNIPIQRKYKTGSSLNQINKLKLSPNQQLFNQDKIKSLESTSEIKPQNKPQVRNKSQQIHRQKKYKRLQEIFNLLDYNEDGIIYYQQMRRERIDSKIYNVFKPIFQEMRILNTHLNCKQFIQAAQRLLASLPLYQRNKILYPKTQKQNNQNYLNKKCYQIQAKINYGNQIIQIKDLYSKVVQKNKYQLNQKSKQKKIRAQVNNQSILKPKVKKYKRFIYTTNIY